ncbi:MAG: hypothetical protein WCE81_12235 [Halobacteriota archaeon]
MEQLLVYYFTTELEGREQHNGVPVFSLISSADEGISYITLSAALQQAFCQCQR